MRIQCPGSGDPVEYLCNNAETLLPNIKALSSSSSSSSVTSKSLIKLMNSKLRSHKLIQSKPI